MPKKPSNKQIPKPDPPIQQVKKEQEVAPSLSVKNLCIALAIISLALYANTIQNGYVYDDFGVIKNNTIVTKGISAIPEILSTPYRRGFFNTANDQYRPLSKVMFAIEYQVSGGSPAISHVVNVMIFAGCVLLLFLFLDRFFERKKTAVAFIASLLFALHPIHTEVVANIKSRDELLCFFFAFLALNVFIKYLVSGRILQLFIGCVCYFLSLLSKETAITFLVIIPLIFFFYRNENKRRSIYITAGTVATAAIFLIIRFSVLSAYLANQSSKVDFLDNMLTGAPSAALRWATTIEILGKYILLLIVPYPLISDYSYNGIPFVSFGNIGVLISLIVYGLLIFFSISGLIKKTKSPFVFPVLFFLATIALFSNVLFFIGTPMGERLLFFPSVGFCLAVALAIEKWIIKTGSADIMAVKSTKVMLVLIPVFLIFSGMTIARNSDWKSNYTLFKTDLEKSPDDSRLYFYLAQAIADNMYTDEKDKVKRREMDMESIGYLKNAIQIYPGFADAHLELGWVYEREQMYDSAIFHYARSLELNPDKSTANYFLGNLYNTAGKYPQAIALFKKAIYLDPGYKVAYSKLAYSYIQTKQYDSAISNCYKLFAIDPDNVDAQQEIGTVFFMEQKYDSAEVHFKQTLVLKPGFIDVINNLGIVYLNAKKFPQSIEQFKKAIAIDPGNMSAYANMGHAYFLAGQYQEAIETFKREFSINPGNGSCIPDIAIAYQKAGKTDSAKKYEAIAKQIYAGFKLP